MRFWSAFLDAWFHAIRSIADLPGRDGFDQRLTPVGSRQARVQERQESIQGLQSPFETQRPRLDPCGERRLGDHLPNQIVGHQMHLKFVARSMRRLATQMVHLQDDLEAPQIQLRLPTTTIQSRDLLDGVFLGVSQRPALSDIFLAHATSRTTRRHRVWIFRGTVAIAAPA
jgi:hypothetical protein